MDGAGPSMGEAELLDSRLVFAGTLIQTWAAPWVAASARPGRYVHVRDPSAGWSLLPRVLPVNTADRARGEITLSVEPGRPSSAWLGRLRRGDRVPMSEALGKGFELEPRSHHLLLAAPSGAMAWLRALVDEALGSGRRVVVVTGAPSAASVYPSSLLPDEVEYTVATDDGSLGHRGTIGELVAVHEAWADQCFAAGPMPLLADLVALSRGRDARLGVARLGRKGRRRPAAPGSSGTRRRSWLQVLPEHAFGCVLGVCLGCVIEGTAGPRRVCRDGPAFAPDELRWPEPA
jgi:dihydroorotate dehydrogenase electron transfer subunit